MLKQRQYTAWSSGCEGFTLVEVLIVVAILAVVVAAMVGAGMAINVQRDTALTKNCLDVLDAALAEFHGITGKYPENDWATAIADNTCIIYSASATGGTPDSDEVLYLQLSILPQTREMISKLPGQLIIEPLSGATVTIGGDTTPYLQSIVDAWGNALNYQRDTANPDTVFPDLWSNGPDGTPGNKDDIN